MGLVYTVYIVYIVYTVLSYLDVYTVARIHGCTVTIFKQN